MHTMNHTNGIVQRVRQDYRAGRFMPFDGQDLSPAADLTVPLHVICGTCKTLRKWLENVPLEWLTPDQGIQIRFPHYPTGTEMEQSALRGCHMCSILWHQLLYLSEKPPEDPDIPDIIWNDAIGDPKKFDQIEFVVYINTKSAAIHLNRPSAASLRLNVSFRKLVRIIKYIGANHEDTAPQKEHIIKARKTFPTEATVLPQSVCTAPTAAKSWALEQVLKCTESHQSCASIRDTQEVIFIPHRYLDVGLEGCDRVYLRTRPQTHDPVNHYMTLSYCWGGQQDFKLTKAFMDTFQVGFSEEALPKTLRDAVHITRWFGIRRLWIDSLCIIQDSVEDWNNESKDMAKIYQHSYLNIAALKASKSREGCFALRDPLLWQPCDLFANGPNDSKHLEGVFMYQSRDEGRRAVGEELIEPTNNFGRAPLLTRGWVLQERLLAPRTLYFGDLLYWECSDGLYTELDARGTTELSPFGSHMGYQCVKNTPLLWSYLTSSDDHAVERQQFIDAWKDTIETFTNLKLTMREDRYAAIAGVIKIASERTGAENLAGLWRTQLLEQLLWNEWEGAERNGRAPS
jgi:Heterokaryon incompatibility protein (HET)